jgi:hypothetical protein
MKYQLLVVLWEGGHIIATSKKADCWNIRTAKKNKAKLVATGKYKYVLIQTVGDVWHGKKVCVL